VSRTRKAIWGLLVVLVFLSLGLNGFLLWQWRSFQRQVGSLRQTAREATSQAITELEAFQKSTLRFDFQVNEAVPIQAEIPFRDALEAPIHTTIPIRQAVDTTVTVDLPQFGLRLPVDVTVPLDLEIPVDLSVPVSIDRTVPISTTVPVSLSVPIVVKMDETELAPYVERLRAGLVAFDQVLSDVGQQAQEGDKGR